MRFTSWLDGLNLRSPRHQRRRARRGAALERHAGCRLTVQHLEDRTVPSFASPADYGVGTSPQAVVSADFNGDGILDLAVANYSDNTVSVLLGNGDVNGTFQPAQTSATGG